jgi:predicted AAA+ superfamily ATPase
MFKRELDLLRILKKGKSQFLFGPRSTGKTSLIRTQLQSVYLIDLLDSKIFLRLSEKPFILENLIVEQPHKLIVIDEIQKIPLLLDEIHRLLEKPKNPYIFLMTGSSARKLKKQSVNLLGGRAGRLELFPIVYKEWLDHKFDLQRILRYGALPKILTSEDPQQELYDYVDNYINEEIRLEALIRNLPPFRRFLKSVALSNSQVINYSSFARDVGVSVPTVKEYFNILEDTLIGFRLEPWVESKKRKAIESSRFYFFDLGVTHTLAETEYLDRNSNLYGQSFEQFIALEIKSYLSYRQKRTKLSFWRTKEGIEVDFILGDKIAIEVKSSQKIQEGYLNGLKKLQEEMIIKDFYLISQDSISQNIKGIHCLPWDQFLIKLWNDEII